MTLSEQIVDNGKADRNFRDLDTRLAAKERALGTTWGPSLLTVPAATAATADRVYYSQIRLTVAATLTGVQWFNVTSAGNVAVALYDSTGVRMANVATPVAVGGALALQQLPFDAAVTAGPGTYFAAIVFDNTPQQYHALLSVPSSYAAGGAGAAGLASITAPTTPAQLVPLISTY